MPHLHLFSDEIDVIGIGPNVLKFLKFIIITVMFMTILLNNFKVENR